MTPLSCFVPAGKMEPKMDAELRERVIYVVIQLEDGPSVRKACWLQNEGIVATLDQVQPMLAAKYPGGEVRRSDCEHPHWTLFLDGKETDWCFMVEEYPADALAPIIAEVEAAALESEERNPWKRAVVELAVVNGTYRSAATPKDMLNEAISFDVKIALDPAVSQAARDLEAAARADEREKLSDYLKPGQTPLERIEQDHKDMLGLMKLLQLEKEKQARLAADVQKFVRHETTDAFRLRTGIANVRKMLGRSRAVSTAAKAELDAELLRLLGADNDPMPESAIRAQKEPSA
jgi:hypothetical protein